MADFNKLFLLGNLTREPELAFTTTGTPLCKFGLAVNRKFKSQGEDKEETLFIETEVWGIQAESCAGYLKKGSQIFAEGRLKLDQWEKDGQRRSRHVFVAERCQFLQIEPKGNKGGEEDEQG